MKKYRRLSALAVLLLIAPAIPALASLCGIRPCPMMEASGECTHRLSLEDPETARQESHEMPCCQKPGPSISALEHGADDCCAISEQESPEAISENRIASPDALRLSGPLEAFSAPTVTIGPEFEAIREKPRPPSALFTLHSAFLI